MDEDLAWLSDIVNLGVFERQGQPCGSRRMKLWIERFFASGGRVHLVLTAQGSEMSKLVFKMSVLPF
ncbi:hypothetical protein GCM10007301_57380 [Azorhizobium oxalatiphilum]|uniref:Uncharacterized protein n=1 Tax=Azorhizobium oxalatiphilum TaxID=980631 RepID=A0A917CL49_9HYPH|nr:hypothetical protein [Azorhizobium oxalatiphilum]GGF90015.1 hypothetical protein GCM10007301_57380 [Azorhizobium oxalatiphilum]